MLQIILIFILFYVIFNFLPKYKYIDILRGTNLIEKGQIEQGLELFKKGAYSKKIDYMTKIRYAFLELKFGNIKEAKKMIMLILGEKIPDNIKYEAKAIFAIILYKEGALEEAKEEALEVYKNYKTTNMYCTLGYLFNMLETPENAVKLNEEAYDYNGDKDVILDNLGQSYYLNKENKKALDIYEMFISKEPKFPEAYYNYALVLIEDNRREEAKQMLFKALTKEFHNLTTITREEVQNKIDEIEEGEF